MDILYRIGAMAFGLLLALTLLGVMTRGGRKAAKQRRAARGLLAADYWSRPARIRRTRSGRRSKAA